jgi:hypothetical protein
LSDSEVSRNLSLCQEYSGDRTREEEELAIDINIDAANFSRDAGRKTKFSIKN